MNTYCWDGNGKELGSLKNEAHEFDVEHFDGLYVGGKKTYILRTGDKHKTSCKGFTFVNKELKDREY